MKKQFKVLLLLLFFSCNSYAQVQYSSRLTKVEIKLFESLRKQLVELPFPSALKIANDTSFSKKEFEIYNHIFRTVIDTTRVNETLLKMEGYKPSFTDQVQRLTLGTVIGMHIMVKCTKDSLFFVMPASEYQTIHEDSSFILPPVYKNIFIAGITGGGYFYPAYQFMLSEKRDKIYFIDILVNFEEGNGSPKSKYSEKVLGPILTPCQRPYINTEPVIPPKPFTISVDK